MPKVTVYIRKTDIEDWKAIEKKTEWVHIHLKDERLKLSKEDVRVETVGSIPPRESRQAIPPIPPKAQPAAVSWRDGEDFKPLFRNSKKGQL